MRLFKHVNFRAAILSVAFLHSTVWAAATLENPTSGALKSGVGLISGWICEADRLEVSLDGGARLFVPYGSDRTDTASICGDTDNGFGLLTNYNELGDGLHTMTLYADGEIVTQVTFNVQTPGTNFLRGVHGGGQALLSNGLIAAIQWEETTQGFTIIGYQEREGESFSVSPGLYGPFWPKEPDALHAVLHDAANGCRVYGEVDRLTYSREFAMIEEEDILSYAVNSDHALAYFNADPFSGFAVKKVRCVSGFALFYDAETCQSKSGFSADLRQKLTLEIFYSTYADYDRDGNIVEDGLPRWDVILHLPLHESLYFYLYYVHRIGDITIKRDSFELVASYYDEGKQRDILFNLRLLFASGFIGGITEVKAYDNGTGAAITLPTRVLETLTTLLQNIHTVVRGEDITPICPR